MNMECDDEVTIEDAGDVVYFTFTPTTSGDYYFGFYTNYRLDLRLHSDSLSSYTSAGGGEYWSGPYEHLDAGETCRIEVRKDGDKTGEFTFMFRITKN